MGADRQSAAESTSSSSSRMLLPALVCLALALPATASAANKVFLVFTNSLLLLYFTLLSRLRRLAGRTKHFQCSMWLPSPTRCARPPVATTEPATPQASAPAWAARRPAAAPPPLASAVYSPSRVAAAPVPTTATPSKPHTLCPQTPTPAPTHSARQTQMSAS